MVGLKKLRPSVQIIGEKIFRPSSVLRPSDFDRNFVTELPVFFRPSDFDRNSIPNFRVTFLSLTLILTLTLMCQNKSEEILQILSSNTLTTDLKREVFSYLPLVPTKQWWGRCYQTDSFYNKKIPERTCTNLRYGKKTYIEEYYQIQHGPIEKRSPKEQGEWGSGFAQDI